MLDKEVKAVRLRNVTQGATYAVNCGVQARQRAIIEAGGLLNFTVFALANFVHYKPREIIVTVPQEKFIKQQR